MDCKSAHKCFNEYYPIGHIVHVHVLLFLHSCYIGPFILQWPIVAMCEIQKYYLEYLTNYFEGTTCYLEHST